MRHATDGDLDRLEPMLTLVRRIGALRERKRGNFQLRSRAFLHFHAEDDRLYADVRLDGADFSRHEVTSPDQQVDLATTIARVVLAVSDD